MADFADIGNKRGVPVSEAGAQAFARQPRVEVSRARPIVVVQVSGGIADYEVWGDTDAVKVVLIDWDNVEGESKDESEEEYSSTQGVRDVLADPELPDRAAEDIRISLERARRFDDLDGD